MARRVRNHTACCDSEKLQQGTKEILRRPYFGWNIELVKLAAVIEVHLRA